MTRRLGRSICLLVSVVARCCATVFGPRLPVLLFDPPQVRGPAPKRGRSPVLPAASAAANELVPPCRRHSPAAGIRALHHHRGNGAVPAVPVPQALPVSAGGRGRLSAGGRGRRALDRLP